MRRSAVSVGAPLVPQGEVHAKIAQGLESLRQGKGRPSLILFRGGDWSEPEVTARMQHILHVMGEGEITQSIVVVGRCSAVRPRRYSTPGARRPLTVARFLLDTYMYLHPAATAAGRFWPGFDS